MCTQILIIFLLFGLQSISTHTIAKFDIKNGTEVYEIRELPNDTVQFINPKAKKPTLREILFYRVIEKPYDEEKRKLSDSSLDFDDSIRHFTNSHGMQFINWDQVEDDYFSKNNESSNESESSDEGEMLTNRQYAPQIDKRFGDVSASDETNVDQDNQSTNQSGTNKKVKGIRKQLFDSISSKYRKRGRMHNSESNSRHIRGINYMEIPQAPTLPDLDVRSFPDYVQNILSNIPSAGNFPAPKNTISAEDAFDDKNRKTYGMSLKNNQGYSWNNIPSKEPERISYTQYTTMQPNLFINLPYQSTSIKQPTESSNENEDLNINKDDEEITNVDENGKIDELFTNSDIFSSTDEKKSGPYQNIPDAPVLPALDVYSFPDNIQKMLSNIPSLGDLPEPVEIGLNENAGNQNTRTDRGVFADKNRRTYGMSLKNNQGYSWNNISSAQPERIAYTQHTGTTIRPNPTTSEPYQSVGQFNNQNTFESPIEAEVEINNNKDNEDDRRSESEGLSPLRDGSKSRTYGMSLKGNTGQVWNELTGAYYNVGDVDINTTEVHDDKYDNIGQSVNEPLTDFLTKQISKLIQDEVTKQLKEFIKEGEDINTSADTYVGDDTNNNESTEIEKDTELEKNNTSISSSKKSPTIQAETIYGNSVGNGNVTNIFIFFPNTGDNKQSSDEPLNKPLDDKFSKVGKNTEEALADHTSYPDKNKDAMEENVNKDYVEETIEHGDSVNEGEIENELDTVSDTTIDSTTDDIDNFTEISGIDELTDQSLERSANESIESESEDKTSDGNVCLHGSSLKMCDENESES